jgi:hypothetical protein
MRLPLPQFSAGDRHPDHLGEAIETSTTEFLAQCLDPDDLSFPRMPPFGSWVKATDEESDNQIYAVVYHATTTPIDSIHRARALGMSLQELREQQPQIFAMLQTEFRAAIVGFEAPAETANAKGKRKSKTNGVARPLGKVYQYIPPRPPQIHQAVYRCTEAEVTHFTEQLDFLRTLLAVNGAPVESLTAAAIRGVYQVRDRDREWLVNTGRMLSMLLKDDYDRLRIILSQIQP